MNTLLCFAVVLVAQVDQSHSQDVAGPQAVWQSTANINSAKPTVEGGALQQAKSTFSVLTELIPQLSDAPLGTRVLRVSMRRE